MKKNHTTRLILSALVVFTVSVSFYFTTSLNHTEEQEIEVTSWQEGTVYLSRVSDTHYELSWRSGEQKIILGTSHAYPQQIKLNPESDQLELVLHASEGGLLREHLSSPRSTSLSQHIDFK
ncbi:hypothetical protein Rhal01_02526 [Rubritalea halochordaticola]|uniref:Uncharacterized protein n=1 Tax=Rubritalea halochordaticola TaxID=714537 RepID=A0ABP9V0Y8_9BACT